MRSAPHRRLLLVAVASLGILGPAGLAGAACPLRPPPPCGPVAFTGSVGDHSSSRCSGKRASGCGDRQGRHGSKGATGRRGATGRDGETGRTGSPGATGPKEQDGTNGAAGATGPAGATGAQGLQGTTGETGADGAPGIQGETGGSGSQGLQGVQGEIGAAGDQGVQGEIGAAGPTGDTGPQGSTGADGPQGPDGADGAQGPIGATGSIGPPGSSEPREYAYVYSTGAQTVPLEASVNFDAGGTLSPGITHSPGAAGITLTNPGIYELAFSVSGTGPNQIALFVNGSVVPGTIYASGAGTQQNTGEGIATIAAGDVLTLRNHTSSAAIGLATPIGGTQASTNASVSIEKLE
jgi:hypothetical protein